MTKTTEHLEALREALRKLAPSGDAGFEGFVAAILSEVCGQPFRLASSGSQRGRDGDSAFDAGATYFEAKRYEDDVPKKEVAVKIMDLANDDQGHVDTWIVCATSEIPALKAQDFRTNAERFGIGIVLLDWSNNTFFPALATVLCIARPSAVNFLQSNITAPGDAALLAKALGAIDHLVSLPEFPSHAAALQAELKSTSVGLGLAKAGNRVWLEEAFADDRYARMRFGQPLAPLDSAALSQAQPRAELIHSLTPAFTGSPSGEVFAVIGYEGAGKSWLVANAWLKSDPASIFLFVPAAEVLVTDIIGFEDFLIQKLIEQTGGERTEIARKRWQRRFRAWRSNPGPANVRLTLCLDGLNQNSRFQWPRLIEGAAAILYDLGGRLVFTTRTTHYPTIRNAVLAKLERVIVPEWSETELALILRARSIDPDVLSAGVLNTLKNPRILSVALKLLDAKEIESVDQLSVPRLLFEHLRTSSLTGTSSLNPQEFAKVLSELAGELISRINEGDQDDLRLFDARDHERLAEISSSRFFQPVGDDPDRYEIVGDGLHLALGIWLVNAVEKENRNKRDPYDQLDHILEPVAALDITAEIVSSAVEVACLKESCPVSVGAALIRHCVNLQNLPDDRKEALSGLVRKRPDAFVAATRDIALSPSAVTSTDWLGLVILKARSDPAVGQVLERELPTWLSFYYLDPERMMLTSRRDDSDEKIQKERERVHGEIQKKLGGLTKTERAFLEQFLVEFDGVGNLPHLHRMAMVLMAGMSLEKFAFPLFAWAFSNALNSSLISPYKEFQHLISLNHVDWNATREALVRALHDLGPDVSTVGNWTAVATLNATGDREDAARAVRIRDELTKDHERFEGWRLVEDYCTTDPCDPTSERPENIERSAQQFRQIEVDKLFTTRGNSGEDHFFTMALPGVARFEGEVGAEVVRRLATNTLTRKSISRRQAILAIHSFSPILEKSHVAGLIAEAANSDVNAGSSPGAEDEWITAQFSLFTALPHLAGNEQLKALDRLKTTAIMLSILDILEPASPELAHEKLTEAVRSSDVDRQIRLIAAIYGSDTPMTEALAALISDLLESPNNLVRGEALAIAASTEHHVLLSKLASTNWDAGGLIGEGNSYERWFGSAALIAAADNGFLDPIEALERIALTHYGYAAQRLGAESANLIGDRLQLALDRALALADLTDVPEIEQRAAGSPSSRPPLVDLREEVAPADPGAVFSRLSESEVQFQNRQRRLHEAYERFSRELTSADARLIVTDLTFAGMKAVLNARSDLIPRWKSLLVQANRTKKRSLHLFATQFAGAIAESHPAQAVEVIEAYEAVEPLIRHVTGLAKVPAEADMLWSLASMPDIQTKCLNRLANCTSDREISVEVIAALRNGHTEILAAYVDRLIGSNEPAQIARAITIAGFSDEADFASRVLAAFEDAEGFLGQAQAAAQAAYKRNIWSRYWYHEMANAANNTDFWRFGVLLSKVVDGRFDLWSNEVDPKCQLFQRFMPVLKDQISRRILKWNDKRKDKLYGGKAPHIIFLVTDFS